MLPSSPVAESLRSDPVLRRAGSTTALGQVAAGMRSRRFRRGEVIFHVGDPGDALFIIVSGEVKISLPSESGDEAILVRLQHRRRLRRAGPARRRARARPPRRPSPRRRPSSCRGTASARSSPTSRRSATPCSRRSPGSCAGSRRTSRSCTSSTSPAASPRRWSASRRRAGRVSTTEPSACRRR